MTTQKNSALRTCLMGTALGDALGFLVDGKPTDDIVRLTRILESAHADSFDPDIFNNFNLLDHRTGESYIPGQITDDTQISLILTRSLRNKTDHGLDDFVKKLVQAYESGAIVAYGDTLEIAAQNIQAGNPIAESGCKTTKSNGAALRAAPIALIYSADSDLLIDHALGQACITHARPAAMIAAVAQTMAVALARQMGALRTLDRERFISAWTDNIVTAIKKLKGHHDLIEPYMILEGMLERSFDEAKALCYAMDDPNAPEFGKQKISHFAPISVLWAVYCFLRSPDYLLQSLGNAISIGGDTDTVAAMTGAISAVYNGPQAIPQWAENWLHDRGRNFATILDESNIA